MNVIDRALHFVGLQREKFVFQRVIDDYERDIDNLMASIEGDTGSPAEVAPYWRPLTRNVIDRALSPAMHDKMLRLCSGLWERDSFARRIVELGVSYVWGSGIRFEAPDPKVRRVLLEHYNDPVNRWETRGEELDRSLRIFGEYIAPAFVNIINGHVRLSSIDPVQVEAIEANPQNAEELQWVLVKGSASSVSSSSSNRVRYRIFHIDNGGKSKYAIDSNGGSHSYSWARNYFRDGSVIDTDGRMIGNCFYFSVNRMPTASRGRSDLFCLVDFLDKFNKLLYLRMRRAEILNRYLMVLRLKRISSRGLEAMKKKYKMPRRSGEVMFINEDMDFNYLTPDLKGGDMSEEMKTLIIPLYAGSGFPPTWFGIGESVNRAAALEMGDPTLKQLQSRQNAIKRMLKEVGRVVIDQKLIFTNELDGVSDLSFKVVAPQISVKDQAKQATVLVQVMNSIVVALREEQLINREQAQQLAALLLSQYGVEFESVLSEDRGVKAKSGSSSGGNNNGNGSGAKLGDKRLEEFSRDLTERARKILREI